MRIGIDFDNTIVSYDALFHRVAREKALIPETLPVSKVHVRDHLRAADRESDWTEMQGYVYGARMSEAAVYPGVLEFFLWARDAVVPLAIVSHKTRHPFLGPKYDLHAAARAWLEQHLRDGSGPMIDMHHVHFRLTKEQKVACIRQQECTHFIDDLPEILMMADFPTSTERVLFDPEDPHPEMTDIRRVRDWFEIRDYCESVWASKR
jgi:hypothetical protein